MSTRKVVVVLIHRLCRAEKVVAVLINRLCRPEKVVAGLIGHVQRVRPSASQARACARSPTRRKTPRTAACDTPTRSGPTRAARPPTPRRTPLDGLRPACSDPEERVVRIPAGQGTPEVDHDRDEHQDQQDLDRAGEEDIELALFHGPLIPNGWKVTARRSVGAAQTAHARAHSAALFELWNGPRRR